VVLVSVMVNPVDAVRTGSLLVIEGTSAFGAASLAFLRFTGGATGAALWLGASLVVWFVVPWVIAARRLDRADI
jgi:Cu-processing system permease protein